MNATLMRRGNLTEDWSPVASTQKQSGANRSVLLYGAHAAGTCGRLQIKIVGIGRNCFGHLQGVVSGWSPEREAVSSVSADDGVQSPQSKCASILEGLEAWAGIHKPHAGLLPSISIAFHHQIEKQK